MDNFLTPKELAKVLKISPRMVNNLINTNKIKAITVGGSKRITYRILEKELDRFIAENYDRLSNE